MSWLDGDEPVAIEIYDAVTAVRQWTAGLFIGAVAVLAAAIIAVVHSGDQQATPSTTAKPLVFATSETST